MIDRFGRDGRRSGFTLIEMMVVISIIIVATGLMVPTLLRHLKTRQLKNAGNVIVSTLNEARSEAVTKRKRLSVCFVQEGLYVYDPEASSFEGNLRRYSPDRLVSYRLMFVDEESQNLDYEERPVMQGADMSLDEVELTAEDIVIHFEPDGTINLSAYADVATDRFKKNEAADIVLDQQGEEFTKGFIDIRAAGMVAFKVEDTSLQEKR